MFHVYQNNWTSVTGALQDEANYPINKDLLALQLLTSEISKKMPNETDADQIQKYLEMYVAIRTKEMEIDPSSQLLVKNMANSQEHTEGTAKYVEAIVSLNTISGFTIDFGGQESSTIQSNSSVREHFAFGIWYDTGAAVTYMLEKKGLDFEADAEDGMTLYDIAKSTVNLTQAQLDTKLQDAKNEFDWSAIETEAQRLVDL